MSLKWLWVLALAGVCVLPGSVLSFALKTPQQSSNPAAADSPDKQSPTAPKTPPPKTEPDQSGAKPTSKSPARRSSTAKKAGVAKATAAKRRKRPISPRVRRIRQAFVASTTLRPMAQQLIADRTPAAYAGVEAYARAHAK